MQENAPLRVDDDVPLLIDSADGTFTANGVAVPDLRVWPKHRIRLRLANATGQFVTLRIDGHPMHVVAIDGQPSEPFLSRDSRITLSPGNRADVLVDAVMAPKSIATIVARREDADIPFARLVYGDGIVPAGATMPDGYAGESVTPLPPNPLPERMDFRGAVRAELLSPRTPAWPPCRTSRCSRPCAAEPSCSRSRTAPARRRSSTSMAITSACSTGSTTAGSRSGSTPSCASRPETTRVAFVADNPGKWLLNARTVGADESQLAWFEVR